MLRLRSSTINDRSTPGATISISFNGQTMDIRNGMTVAELLADTGIRGKLVAVEINLEIVPNTLHERRLLEEGDSVEAVTLVGGG